MNVKASNGFDKALVITLAMWFAFGNMGQAHAEEGLMELSLEELLDVSITSVSKKEQRLFDAAAAIYVITSEDIHRSGAQNIPEALILAPGVHVARIDGNKWAVSVRGFNNRFANKLLVLIDGRSVYSSLFSGILWEELDVVMENVERIEVIRGPGATLWGSNAVNGIINIITKSAKDTQGGLVVGGGGGDLYGGLFRFGSRAESVAWRVQGKFSNQAGAVDRLGTRMPDDWKAYRVGFRVDKELEKGIFTVMGNVQRNKSGSLLKQTVLAPPFNLQVEDESDFKSGVILGNLNWQFSARSDMIFQLNFEQASRKNRILNERVGRLDGDFQHRFSFASKHELIWGIRYRQLADKLPRGFIITMDPENRTRHQLSGFVQHEFRLAEDQLRLTSGLKLERHDFAGFEVQPNFRVLWTPDEKTAVWGSISRAVRTPSRLEHDLEQISVAVLPSQNGPPAVLTFTGSTDIKSETLLAYELGYREQLTETFFFDAAFFYHDFDDLVSNEPEMPMFNLMPIPYINILSRLDNGLRGDVKGGEVVATWRVNSQWRFNAGYSGQDVTLSLKPGSQDTVSVSRTLGRDPTHQFQLQVRWSLSKDLSMGVGLHYIAALQSLDTPAITRLNTQMSWHPTSSFELVFIGRDMIEGRRQEFKNDFDDVVHTYVGRQFYAKGLIKF